MHDSSLIATDIVFIDPLNCRVRNSNGRVAQLVEHSTLNRLVVGSIPTASTNN